MTHAKLAHQVKDLFVLNFRPNPLSGSVCERGHHPPRSRTPAAMQRALFRRSAMLAHPAAAALDGPLAARSAPPPLLRPDRSMSSVTIPPPACMLRPLEVPFRYLFGPGPSNVPPRVLASGSRPIIGHLHPEMYQVTALKLSYATQSTKLWICRLIFIAYDASCCMV